MACPTCIKLGIIAQQTNKGRFCSQDCFKVLKFLTRLNWLLIFYLTISQLFWEEHKGVHKDAKKSQLPSEFKSFRFSGPLRPYQKSPRRVVPPEIMRPDYADGETFWTQILSYHYMNKI